MNNVYHTAFLVPRIEDAMRDYGRALGVTFRPPLVRSYDRIQQRSSDGPATGRMTYSIEGPVYIELVEISGEGMYAPSERDGVHHVGMWSADPLGQAREMAVAGFEWEASLYAKDGSVPVVFVRRGGVRIELVTEARRQMFMDWLAGESTPA